MNLINSVEEGYKREVPSFNVGDTVRVGIPQRRQPIRDETEVDRLVSLSPERLRRKIRGIRFCQEVIIRHNAGYFPGLSGLSECYRAGKGDIKTHLHRLFGHAGVARETVEHAVIYSRLPEYPHRVLFRLPAMDNDRQTAFACKPEVPPENFLLDSRPRLLCSIPSSPSS